MSNEIDIDAFVPDPPVDPAQLAMEHAAAEERALAAMSVTSATMVETSAAAPALRPTKPPPVAREQLRGMIFASAHGSDPHIVTFTGEGAARDAACTCKAGTFNLPVGCYAMVFARTVAGLPAQGAT